MTEMLHGTFLFRCVSARRYNCSSVSNLLEQVSTELYWKLVRGIVINSLCGYNLAQVLLDGISV